jgi:hypothetical protein
MDGTLCHRRVFANAVTRGAHDRKPKNNVDRL